MTRKMKAQDVLDRLSISTPPVDVIAIASAYGIVVNACESAQWDAAIDMGPPPVIYLDAASLERQRFALAHELGHFFLHRAEQKTFRDRFGEQGLDPYEIEANMFAAELLMPWSWVMAYARHERPSQMAKRFGVSAAAMDMRLREAMHA